MEKLRASNINKYCDSNDQRNCGAVLAGLTSECFV